jgi:putative transposase
MVRYRRNFTAGGIFFFTVTLADRRSRALVEHIESLRSALRTTQTERRFAIDAIVVLPDHLHTIITLPSGDADFSGRWRRIKGLFTRDVIQKGASITRDARGEFSLWQKRFWEHTVRNEEDYSRHVDYIHYNPVKHGLVSRVCDWPYSSFHKYVRRGWIPEDWGGVVDISERGFGESTG